MTLDLGVVTTAWNGYGRYLPAWARSIAAQTVKPTRATIVTKRSAGPGRDQAKKILDAAGIACRLVDAELPRMGQMRNRAVAATPTEWVMHLDADDTLLPHAVADVARLAPHADVVSLGCRRGQREVLFTGVTAAKILRGGQLGSFSPSPYRRSFWKRRPYIEVNDWVESAFWVGLAHLGARFVGTRRVGFIYRQHGDSHSHTLSRDDRRAALNQLGRLRRRWDLGAR